MTAKEQGFDFGLYDVVKLLEDHPNDDLNAGDMGIVWGFYQDFPPYLNFPPYMDAPPHYEGDFYRGDGTGTAMPFTADEVEVVEDRMSIGIPNDVLEWWQCEAKRHPHS